VVEGLVPDEAGDVLERFPTLNDQRRDHTAPASVGAECGGDAGSLRALLQQLGHGLAQHQAAGGRREHEADRLAAVGVLLPLRGHGPFLVLHLLAAAEHRRDGGHQPVLTASAVGRGRTELPASPVDVHRRTAHAGSAGVEVEVLPSEAEHLGDSPALEEQEGDRGAEPVIDNGGEQRLHLVRLQGRPLRVRYPQRLHGSHRIPGQGPELHRLVDHLGQLGVVTTSRTIEDVRVIEDFFDEV
jgi:hypothetical protein